MRNASGSLIPLGLGVASLVPGLFGSGFGSVALIVGALIAGWHLHEAPARAGILVATPLAVLVVIQLVRGGSPVDDVGLVTVAMAVITVAAMAVVAAHIAAGTRRRLQRRRDMV